MEALAYSTSSQTASCPFGARAVAVWPSKLTFGISNGFTGALCVVHHLEKQRLAESAIAEPVRGNLREREVLAAPQPTHRPAVRATRAGMYLRCWNLSDCGHESLIMTPAPGRPFCA